ncbi:unnamed protein product [Ostreobium quekettii]|uniref:Uncharacterized protein n=1 Tax=Ostreobium quekettii TaxID=121088 RepID=A0A8S1J6S0_9CHLO|nr:unnamed protein product [Ostreobium quekettii]
MHQHYVQDERPKKDYSLKPGQTLHVQVPKHSSPVSTGSLSEKLPAGPMPVVSTSGTGALKITPPPAPPGPRTSQPPLSARGEAPPLLGDDGEDAVGRPAGGSEQAVPKDGTGDGSSHGLPVIPTDPDEGEDGRAAGGGAEATPGGAQAGGEDDWGDFVG